MFIIILKTRYIYYIMSFENNIKTWVKTDNEIKKLSDKIKELKGERVKIEEIIIN